MATRVITPEQKARKKESERMRFANLTSEEVALRNSRQNERNRRIRESLTEGENEARKAKKRDELSAWLVKLTPEEHGEYKAVKSECTRLRYASFSPEEKEVELQRAKEYRKNNPHVDMESRVRRDYSKALNVTEDERKEAGALVRKLLRSEVNICSYCDCNIPKGKVQIDHIMPLTRGGLHRADNLCVSCATCNHSKYNKILFKEWFPKNYKRIA